MCYPRKVVPLSQEPIPTPDCGRDGSGHAGYQHVIDVRIAGKAPCPNERVENNTLKFQDFQSRRFEDRAQSRRLDETVPVMRADGDPAKNEFSADLGKRK